MRGLFKSDFGYLTTWAGAGREHSTTPLLEARLPSGRYARLVAAMWVPAEVGEPRIHYYLEVTLPGSGLARRPLPADAAYMALVGVGGGLAAAFMSEAQWLLERSPEAHAMFSGATPST